MGSRRGVVSEASHAGGVPLGFRRVGDGGGLAGRLGLGGAAFPTHVKMSPPKEAVLDTLVVNGCECEPFLTADHRVMIERTAGLMAGIRYAMHAVGVSRALIGVEDDKPEAIAAIKALLQAKGWQHTVLITDCLGCGGMPEGSYTSGGMDVIMKDNLCWLADGKSIAGSVLTLAQGVKNIVDWGIASADIAIRMATEVPARSAHIEDKCGSIMPGRDADFVVFDHELTLVETYVGGQSVGNAFTE